MAKSSSITEIEKEYERIEQRWLALHYKTFMVLILFAFFVECVMSIVLSCTGYIDLTASYFKKYLAVPTFFNASFIALAYFTMHSSLLTRGMKKYVVSLLFVSACVVLYFVHHIFISLYLIFTIPIVLTLVYSNYALTTVTALCSMLSLSAIRFYFDFSKDLYYGENREICIYNFVICIFVMIALCLVCMVAICFQKEKNNISIHKELERYYLKERIKKDELTTINNRTALQNALQAMIRDTSGNKYSLAMIDIDNFKLLNDTLGHDQGDTCLKEFGCVLKLNCTETVTPFRFGGDEFCILFKNQSTDDVMGRCKTIQQAFQDISVVNTANLSVSVSFGIAEFTDGMTIAQLMKHADSALYHSKTTKNAISVYVQQNCFTEGNTTS